METGLLRVALTGGIATGKSHCAARFIALGVPVIDSDQLARDAVAPGTAGLAEVRERFGPPAFDAEGRLDRAALARIVFEDEAGRRDLEQIIHPRVYAALADWFARLEAARPALPVALAQIPLLFETGHERDYHRIVVAACRPDQQIERLRARDGLTEEEARRRVLSQMPLADKVARADYVIDTSGQLAETDRQVDELLGELTRTARK